MTTEVFIAANDVAAHVDAWINLLRRHIASLPDDLPETAHEDGTSDKSYAQHELRAMERDLPALLNAVAKLPTPTAA